MGLEYINHFPAMGTFEPTHILHKAQNSHVYLTAKIYGFSDIRQWNLLGRGHDQGTGIRDGLGYGQWLVARTGRCVNDHIVEIHPLNIRYKLSDNANFKGPPPDRRHILVFSHKGFNGNHFHIWKILYGVGFTTLCGWSNGSFQSKHTGYAGSVKIHVHEPNLETLLRKGHWQIGGHAALAHTSFSTHNQNLVLDMVQSLFNLNILLLMLILLAIKATALVFLCHLSLTSDYLLFL